MYFKRSSNMDVAHENQLSKIRQNIKQKSGNNEETNIFPKVGIVFIDDISDSKKTLKIL